MVAMSKRSFWATILSIGLLTLLVVLISVDDMPTSLVHKATGIKLQLPGGIPYYNAVREALISTSKDHQEPPTADVILPKPSLEEVPKSATTNLSSQPSLDHRPVLSSKLLTTNVLLEHGLFVKSIEPKTATQEEQPLAKSTALEIKQDHIPQAATAAISAKSTVPDTHLEQNPEPATDAISSKSTKPTMDAIPAKSIVPEIKPASVPEVKPVSVPEIKPVIVPEIKPVSVPEIKPVIVPEIKPVTVPEINPASVPEINPASVPEIKPASVPEIKPETKPESATDGTSVKSTFPVIQQDQEPQLAPADSPSTISEPKHDQPEPDTIQYSPEEQKAERSTNNDLSEHSLPSKDKAYMSNSNMNQTYATKHVLYNAVGKCGSRAFANAVCGLHTINNFKCVQMKYFGSDLLVTEKVRREFVESIVHTEEPIFFYRHFKYVDFSRYGYQDPIYINVIRDPLEQRASRFYWDLTLGFHNGPNEPKTFEECIISNNQKCRGKESLEISFFVDSEPCLYGNDHCLARAKETIMNKYLLVGITEDLKAFTYILEKEKPSMFAGLFRAFVEKDMQGYFKGVNYTAQHRPTVPDHIRAMMKEPLAYDYELYSFVQQVFYNKLASYPYEQDLKSLLMELQKKYEVDLKV